MRGPKLATMAWRNLWRNRRRTILTLLSIAVGTLLAVMFTAMQDRNWADTIDLAARLGGGHVSIVHPQFLDGASPERSVAGVAALRERAAALGEVRRAVPRITGEGMVATGEEGFGVSFLAYDPAAEDDTTLSFLEGISDGALPGPGDDRGIVLGRTLARNLGVAVGDEVTLTTLDRRHEFASGAFVVRGLIGTGAPTIDVALCLIPIDRARALVGYGPDEATMVAVFLADCRDTDEVAARLAAGASPGATAIGWHEVAPQLASLIAMKTGGARAIELVIALLVAAGIFNTLFVGVLERLREFGILMAVGFRPGQLARLVLWESVWLAVVGLVAGILLTAGPYLYLSAHGLDLSGALGGGQTTEVAGIGMPTHLNVGIYPENALIIGVAVVVATLLAGLYPAWRAARVAPVETIKLV